VASSDPATLRRLQGQRKRKAEAKRQRRLRAKRQAAKETEATLREAEVQAGRVAQMLAGRGQLPLELTPATAHQLWRTPQPGAGPLEPGEVLPARPSLAAVIAASGGDRYDSRISAMDLVDLADARARLPPGAAHTASGDPFRGGGARGRMAAERGRQGRAVAKGGRARGPGAAAGAAGLGAGPGMLLDPLAMLVGGQSTPPAADRAPGTAPLSDREDEAAAGLEAWGFASGSELAAEGWLGEGDGPEGAAGDDWPTAGVSGLGTLASILEREDDEDDEEEDEDAALASGLMDASASAREDMLWRARRRSAVGIGNSGQRLAGESWAAELGPVSPSASPQPTAGASGSDAPPPSWCGQEEEGDEFARQEEEEEEEKEPGGERGRSLGAGEATRQRGIAAARARGRFPHPTADDAAANGGGGVPPAVRSAALQSLRTRPGMPGAPRRVDAAVAEAAGGRGLGLGGAHPALSLHLPADDSAALDTSVSAASSVAGSRGPPRLAPITTTERGAARPASAPSLGRERAGDARSVPKLAAPIRVRRSSALAPPGRDEPSLRSGRAIGGSASALPPLPRPRKSALHYLEQSHGLLTPGREGTPAAASSRGRPTPREDGTLSAPAAAERAPSPAPAPTPARHPGAAALASAAGTGSGPNDPGWRALPGMTPSHRTGGGFAPPGDRRGRGAANGTGGGGDAIAPRGVRSADQGGSGDDDGLAAELLARLGDTEGRGYALPGGEEEEEEESAPPTREAADHPAAGLVLGPGPAEAQAPWQLQGQQLAAASSSSSALLRADVDLARRLRHQARPELQRAAMGPVASPLRPGGARPVKQRVAHSRASRGEHGRPARRGAAGAADRRRGPGQPQGRSASTSVETQVQGQASITASRVEARLGLSPGAVRPALRRTGGRDRDAGPRRTPAAAAAGAELDDGSAFLVLLGEDLGLSHRPARSPPTERERSAPGPDGAPGVVAPGQGRGAEPRDGTHVPRELLRELRVAPGVMVYTPADEAMLGRATAEEDGEDEAGEQPRPWRGQAPGRRTGEGRAADPKGAASTAAGAARADATAGTRDRPELGELRADTDALLAPPAAGRRPPPGHARASRDSSQAHGRSPPRSKTRRDGPSPSRRRAGASPQRRAGGKPPRAAKGLAGALAGGSMVAAMADRFGLSAAELREVVGEAAAEAGLQGMGGLDGVLDGREGEERRRAEMEEAEAAAAGGGLPGGPRPGALRAEEIDRPALRTAEDPTARDDDGGGDGAAAAADPRVRDLRRLPAVQEPASPMSSAGSIESRSSQPARSHVSSLPPRPAARPLLSALSGGPFAPDADGSVTPAREPLTVSSAGDLDSPEGRASRFEFNDVFDGQGGGGGAGPLLSDGTSGTRGRPAFVTTLVLPSHPSADATSVAGSARDVAAAGAPPPGQTDGDVSGALARLSTSDGASLELRSDHTAEPEEDDLRSPLADRAAQNESAAHRADLMADAAAGGHGSGSLSSPLARSGGGRATATGAPTTGRARARDAGAQPALAARAVSASGAAELSAERGARRVSRDSPGSADRLAASPQVPQAARKPLPASPMSDSPASGPPVSLAGGSESGFRSWPGGQAGGDATAQMISGVAGRARDGALAGAAASGRDPSGRAAPGDEAAARAAAREVAQAAEAAAVGASSRAMSSARARGARRVSGEAATGAEEAAVGALGAAAAEAASAAADPRPTTGVVTRKAEGAAGQGRMEVDLV